MEPEIFRMSNKLVDATIELHRQVRVKGGVARTSAPLHT